MKAFTLPLALLPPPQCLATVAGGSRISCRGRSCANDSLPLAVPLFASASVRDKEAESLRRFLPTDHHRPSRSRNVIRAETGRSATSSTVQESQDAAAKEDGKSDKGKGTGEFDSKLSIPDRVKHVKTIKEFDEALVAAKNKLVVVEYAATHSKNSRKIYPAMVDLSKAFKGVVFLIILGDETDETKELCRRAGVRKVPHFIFYKNSQKIHEEEGITSEVLEGDVLYYGDIEAPIFQVTKRSDFEVLLKEHASDQKLLVVDIGLKSCGPCAKVYPTVVKLAKKMAETTVFARMHGDENPECASIIKSMGVQEVPTFLFIRDGKPLGRYVGSGRGELVGEILKHNGVFDSPMTR